MRHLDEAEVDNRGIAGDSESTVRPVENSKRTVGDTNETTGAPPPAQPPDPFERFVLSDAPRIRCVAGPGTGKTYGLKHRVIRLLGNDVVGARIFAVTFTRQAAAQLKLDLTGVGVSGAEDIHTSTLHSYAFKLLSEEHAIEALGRWPRPCFKFELAPFFHDLAQPLGNVTAAKTQLRAFEAMWARLQTEEPGLPTANTDQAFHSAYNSWMTFHRALHIGELIPLAIRYLRQNPQLDVFRSFDHVLVDEYQDLNRADQEFISLIGQDAHSAIVGDDDQSIYSFRYAHPEGIRTWFEEQDNPKEDVELTPCWRCGGEILAIANHIIQQNPDRLRGDLHPLPGREDSGDVTIVQWHTRERETRGIVQGVQNLLNSGLVPDEEKLVILVPRHEFGRMLFDELAQSGFTDMKVHTKMDWTDVLLGRNLTLLRLLNDPEDRVALRYWLGLDHQLWRRNEYRRLREGCEQRGISPSTILQDEELCTELRVQPLRQRWVELQEDLTDLQDLDEPALLDRLLPLEGPTEELGTIMRTLRQQGFEGTLSELLAQSILSPEENPLENKVNIMTYYGAKGLTAHTVIVTGLINGVMPRNPRPANAEEEAKLQEERRLFFVTLTRAKECVVLSSFLSAPSGENAQLELGLRGGGYRRTTQASRFLSELGPAAPEVVTGETWLTQLQALPIPAVPTPLIDPEANI